MLTEAEAGALYLDAYGPPEWAKDIELDRLDISNTCNCILGQLYANFSNGLISLGVPGQVITALGFEIKSKGNELLDELEYTRVTDDWRTEINKRVGSSEFSTSEKELAYA